MISKHILLLDGQKESRRNTSFLFRLAGFQVTAFEDEPEALNWIVSLRQSSDPIHLVVMRNLAPSNTRQAIIAGLSRLDPDLPMLVVEPGPEEGGTPDWPVHPCRAEEMFEAVKVLLGKSDTVPWRIAHQ